jgi:hypothetical protein
MYQIFVVSKSFINGEKLMQIRQQLFLILLVFSYATQADSSLMVVESTPANLFKAGQILKGEGSIKLSKGQSVTLIANRIVYTLSRNKFGKLIREVDEREDAVKLALQKIGNVKKNSLRDGETEPPNIWMANIDASGHYCALKSKITLWRPDANRSATLIIEADNSSTEVKIAWPAGKQTTTFAFQEGTKYWAYFTNNQDNEHSLTFYQIPANITYIPRRVVWMARKGCIQQATRCFASKSECK